MSWDAEMNIVVNGEARTVNDGTTVRDFLSELGLDPRYLAVEINQQVVPRATHAATCLQPGDQVEIVTLVGGG